MKKFSIRGVGLLSFIILTGDLWEALSGSSISCASPSLPTRYLLCSIRDVTDLGVTCLKLLNHGITIDYVDPANLVYSYTEDPNFEDIYYVGELKAITIPELKKEFPNISDEELKAIKELNHKQIFAVL